MTAPRSTSLDTKARLESLERSRLELESRLRLCSDALSRVQDAVLITDGGGSVTFWNEPAATLYGLSGAEALGRSLSECFRVIWLRPDDERAAAAALASGGGWRGECIHLTAAGARVHVEADIHAAPVEPGGPMGTVVVVRDLTERNLAQRILHDTEVRFRAIVASMSEGFVLAEIIRDNAGRAVDFRLLEVNPAFGRLTGIPPEYATGRTARELEADFEPGPVETYDAVVTTGRPVIFEREFDRHHKWLEVHAFKVGENRFGHLSIDITARKLAEQALRESQARLSGIVGSAMDAIISVDEDQHIVLFNDAAAQMLRCRTEEVLGQPLSRFIPGRHRHAHERHIGTFGHTGVTSRQMGSLGEIGGVRADGEEFPIEASISQVEAGGKKLFTVILRDITARKQAEAAIERAREELEQRVRERTSELAESNAELRRRTEQLARLASQLTMAEQRERRQLARVLHDHLQQLLVAAEYSLEVLLRRAGPELQPAIDQIKSLLDESITASRSLTVELSPSVLHEAGLPAALEWLARRKQQKYDLSVEVQIDSRAARVREDVKVLLFQAVRELLFNVHKHAKVKSASLRLGLEGPDRVFVEVSDEGVGFDRDAVAKAAHREESGFGLFSIGERITLLGGTLDVATAPGKGTKVRLTAPSLDVKKAGAPDDPGAEERDVAEEPADVEHLEHGLRVLLVDDHIVVRQGLMLLLKDEPGVQVVGEAGNGEEAITMARRLKPDVILMDLNMPRMNGVEATRLIHAELPEIRIIGLSMFEERHWADAMLDAGATAHMTKSGKPEILVAAVRGTTDMPSA